MSLALKVSKAAARGDPGLFGDIGKALGGIAKGAVSAVKTVGGVASRTGLPGVSQVGALANRIADVIDGPDDAMFQGPSVLDPVPRVTGTVITPGGLQGSIEASPGEIARMAQAIEQQTGGAMTMNANGHVCDTKGMRKNKSTYFLKDGTRVEAGTRCVKARRMDPMNSRALRKSIRRIEGAKRFAEDLRRITVRKKCE